MLDCYKVAGGLKTLEFDGVTSAMDSGTGQASRRVARMMGHVEARPELTQTTRGGRPGAYPRSPLGAPKL